MQKKIQSINQPVIYVFKLDQLADTLFVRLLGIYICVASHAPIAIHTVFIYIYIYIYACLFFFFTNMMENKVVDDSLGE